MNKKSTKSIKPAAPQVKSAKTSPVSTVKPKEAKPAKKAAVRSKKAAASAPPPVAPPPPAPAAAALAMVAPAPVLTPAAAPAAAPRITVTAQIDIGFGNELFIRGEGATLSWDVGRRMTCVADDQWAISFDECAGPVAFKLLVNDLTWSAGENYVASPGDAIVVTPVF